jgi:glucuronoarabinoxylan endo-1,4-beta-xylanase
MDRRKQANPILLFLAIFSALGILVVIMNYRATSSYKKAAELADGGFEEIAATVYWDRELQEINGFGGSFAFKRSEGLMRLDEPTRTQLLDMIFSREKGIGVSILRLMIGDEENGIADIIEPEKGVFVWDDPEWESKKADFDKGQIWLVNEAKKRGVTTFISTAWSPPAWMKTNNDYKGYSKNGAGMLKKEYYQDYADYLAEYVLGYKKYYDIDISYISFANEPSITPNFPGCYWTTSDMNVFIRDYLGPTFRKKGVKAGIAMPEDIGFDEISAIAALSDPVTEKFIDVVSVHAYGIGSFVREFPLTKEKGKLIWQTEYMNQGERFQTYNYNTISDALWHAGLMSKMFTNTGINAYFYWWLAANNGADGSDLIRLCTDGAPNSHTENGLYRVFKRFYGFGNFSRFIKPGYRMLKTEKESSEDVLITAFKEPGTGSFTIVAVNKNAEEAAVTFNLEGFPDNIAEVVPYRTSAGENLKRLNWMKVDAGTLKARLKGKSITTFVSKGSELDDLNAMKDVFSVYEAEENDGISAGLVVTDCPEGGKMVTGIVNNSYIKYSDVNFGDGTACGIDGKMNVLFMNARVAPLGGGNIEVRIDDPVSGKVVGIMEVKPEDGQENWVTVSAELKTIPDGACGIHDLYLVFTDGKDRGEDGSGNGEASDGNMFDVDNFSFFDGDTNPFYQETLDIIKNAS